MSEDKEEPCFGVLYKKRWLILIIFCFCSMTNAYHWIHLNIISDRVLYVWKVSIPATWLQGRYGLRVSVTSAAFVNAIGAWLKCVAVYLAADPKKLEGSTPSVAELSGFPVLMLAQTLDAIAQVFILGVPAQLAATWFGDREVSTATSIGVLANQLGAAIGFAIPTEVVPSVIADGVPGADPNPMVDFATIRQRMMYLLIIGAAVNSLPPIAALIFFKEEPPKPPTYSQYVRRLAKIQARVGQSKSLPSRSAVQPVESGDLMTSPDQGYSTMTTVLENTYYENEKSEAAEKNEKQLEEKDDEVESHRTLKSTGANKSAYKQQLLNVLKNVNFMLLLVSYGINTGIYYAVGTLLNPILAQYFGGNPNIGWIGFTVIVAGILGSVLAGIWLDKTKKYRLVILITYAIALVWMCGFTGLLLLERIDVAFVASFFLGLAMTGFLPIGFEFAAELTYPADEGLTSGLLNASAQIFGIIFITSASHMVGLYDVKYTNTYFTVLLAVGFILLLLVKEDLRRLTTQSAMHAECITKANEELSSSQL
ncbi:Feline leukemia virus subgroup C cellular receptor, variant 2 [Clonorchis sinensis]|uniref:Feline leukemia virus subgroup C cellular receptor, variant 2 n=1 Tax=Clonorchis sinensis TaxID=79923 RepID=A0A8T1N1R8_CLOSI|nr:Feline leukemia virus subgroup C cellular receptor, variant 2 [Clonorchis sinensis]